MIEPITLTALDVPCDERGCDAPRNSTCRGLRVGSHQSRITKAAMITRRENRWHREGR